jgi:hypothetical protein
MSIEKLINRFIETLESESYEDPSIMANDAYDSILNNTAALSSGNTIEFREFLQIIGFNKIPKTVVIFELIESYFNSKSE